MAQSPIPGIPASALPDVPGLVGPVAITAQFSLLVYGITVVQSYVYIKNYRQDPTWIKGLVYAITCLETVHTAVVFVLYWGTFINSRNDLLSVAHIPWTVPTVFLISIIIGALVEGFYVRRIWVLSNHSKALLVYLGSVLFLRIGFAFVSFYYFVTLDTWVFFRDETGPLVTISSGLGFAVLMDLSVTFLLTLYLFRNRSGLRRTQNILTFIIAYTVNTGALVMAVSMLIVFTFAFMKQNLIFAGFNLVAGKLYANSLLGTLNARKVLRQPLSKTAIDLSKSGHRAVLQSNTDGTKMTVASNSTQGTLVNIKTHVESRDM